MKKILPLILGVFLVFGVASMAIFNSPVNAEKPQYRNSQKLTLYEVVNGNSANVTEEAYKGHVTLVTPRGSNDVVVNGVIEGLNPDTLYYVWMRNLTGYTGEYLSQYSPLGYFKLVTFTTDEYGNGDFHIKIAEEDLPSGTYQIQVAINYSTSPSSNGYTVAATNWNGVMGTEIVVD